MRPIQAQLANARGLAIRLCPKLFSTRRSFASERSKCRPYKDDRGFAQASVLQTLVSSSPFFLPLNASCTPSEDASQNLRPFRAFALPRPFLSKAPRCLGKAGVRAAF